MWTCNLLQWLRTYLCHVEIMFKILLKYFKISLEMLKLYDCIFCISALKGPYSSTTDIFQQKGQQNEFRCKSQLSEQHVICYVVCPVIYYTVLTKLNITSGISFCWPCCWNACHTPCRWPFEGWNMSVTVLNSNAADKSQIVNCWLSKIRSSTHAGFISVLDVGPTG